MTKPKELRAATRLAAKIDIDMALQRLHERRNGLPYSGLAWSEARGRELAASDEDLDRVVPRHDGMSADHELAVAVDKLDRMPERRHNFDPESVDIGSMDRPVGEELVRKLTADTEREFTVQLADSYNEEDGTMNIVSFDVMALSTEQAIERAEAKLASLKAAGAKVVKAAISQQVLLDAYKRRMQAGRETGFGGGVLLYSQATGRFLFIKRSETGDCPGTWCVPGGGIEDGETIDQGTKRELSEECGYDEPIELLFMHRDVQPNFIFHNHMAVVPDEFEPTLNEEHTDYKWCGADELPEPMHPRLEHAMSEWTRKNGAQE